MEERAAYSPAEFCRAHGISRTLYYDQKRRGNGPRTFKVGRRELISREAAADWRRQREASHGDRQLSPASN